MARELNRKASQRFRFDCKEFGNAWLLSPFRHWQDEVVAVIVVARSVLICLRHLWGDMSPGLKGYRNGSAPQGRAEVTASPFVAKRAEATDPVTWRAGSTRGLGKWRCAERVEGGRYRNRFVTAMWLIASLEDASVNL